MTYQSRPEFIEGLKDALSRYGISEQREILLDFEQHFSDGAAAGETEAQVCEKLGDPEEIAKQYIPDAELSLGENEKSETELFRDASEPLREPEPLRDAAEPSSAEEAPLGTGFGAESEGGSYASEAAFDRVFEAGESAETSFPIEGLRRIDVRIASAAARIAASDKAAAEVYYRAGRTGIRFSAKLENGTLFIRESANPSLLPGGRASELELSLPRKTYEEFTLRLASGKIFAEDLTGERFTAEVLSGHARLGIFADEIGLTVRSGHLEAYNCLKNGGRTVRLLRAENSSGKTDVRGFSADQFTLSLKSGSLTAEGLSGKGDADVKSGFLTLGYASWNGELSLGAASGTVKLTLPRGSGVLLDTNIRSGSVTAELDGESARLSHGKGLVKLGSGEHRPLTIDLSSGSVQIGNHGSSAEAAPPPYTGAVGTGLPPAPPPVIKSNRAPDAGKIVGAVIVDLFVLSWALPTLASLVIALFAVAFSLAVTGITSLVGGTMMGVTDVSSWFVSGFSPISTVLFGATLTAGAVLLTLAAIKAATGFINLILRIVNWHARAFVGHNVCTLIGKKYKSLGA